MTDLLDELKGYIDPTKWDPLEYSDYWRMVNRLSDWWTENHQSTPINHQLLTN
jgi:hypothetical protein